MPPVSCIVATTQRQLDDALRVRWAVFAEEMRLLGGTPPVAPRELDCFDTLETTMHLVVYVGIHPVATARLLLPNLEVVKITGWRHGIALEQKLDLSSLGGPDILLAESTRFCILKEWRHSQVLVHLQAGLYLESRRRKVTHWIASANTETDSAEDAALLSQVAAHKQLMSQRWRVEAREPSLPPVPPSAPLYTPLERARGREGQLDGLRLPRPLALFAHKMGARFISSPIYDRHFCRFSMPLIAALSEIPASTLALFHARAAGAPCAA